MFCYKCGNKLPDNSKFCPNCGSNQNPADNSQPAASSASPTPVNSTSGSGFGAKLHIPSLFKSDEFFEKVRKIFMGIFLLTCLIQFLGFVLKFRGGIAIEFDTANLLVDGTEVLCSELGNSLYILLTVFIMIVIFILIVAILSSKLRTLNASISIFVFSIINCILCSKFTSAFLDAISLDYYVDGYNMEYIKRYFLGSFSSALSMVKFAKIFLIIMSAIYVAFQVYKKYTQPATPISNKTNEYEY